MLNIFCAIVCGFLVGAIVFGLLHLLNKRKPMEDDRKFSRFDLVNGSFLMAGIVVAVLAAIAYLWFAAKYTP